MSWLAACVEYLGKQKSGAEPWATCKAYYSLTPMHTMDFPGGSDGKVSAYNARDPGSIPTLGRSPREGNGNPLQYSCFENPMDGGAWWATVHGVTESQTRRSSFTMHSMKWATYSLLSKSSQRKDIQHWWIEKESSIVGEETTKNLVAGQAWIVRYIS